MAAVDSISKTFGQGLVNPKPYDGPCEVKHEKTDSSYTLSIKTEHLVGRYATSGDIENYRSLFMDKDVMALYLDGEVWEEKKLKRILTMWQKRHIEKITPLTAVAFFEKNEDGNASDRFIGHVAVGGGEATAALGYAIHPRYQNKGYGKEAVYCMVHHYAMHFFKDLGITSIKATCDPKNVKSARILADCGFKLSHYPEEKEKKAKFIYTVVKA